LRKTAAADVVADVPADRVENPVVVLNVGGYAASEAGIGLRYAFDALVARIAEVRDKLELIVDLELVVQAG
jgi:hypothetical protein